MKIPDTVQERRQFIKEQLLQYKDMQFYCPALGCKIKVIDKSIDETAYYAAISKEATRLAIRLPMVIRNAVVLQLHLPPKIGRRQTKKMKFVEIANLLATISRLGKAKLTVGFTTSNECIEYAITQYQP